MRVVISQPMYMPWYGIFEQMRACDVFIHYDDVQLPSSSSFMTRVQINGCNGVSWLSIPVRRTNGRLTLINECHLLETEWRKKHLSTLYHSYKKCSKFEEMYDIAESVILFETTSLAEFTIHGLEFIACYLGISTKFFRSSLICSEGKKSDRLLSICNKFDATHYITGRGALAYLDHGLFERANISVLYPSYGYRPFLHEVSTFTPYVSMLDFIAHKGTGVLADFNTSFSDWRHHVTSNRSEI